MPQKEMKGIKGMTMSPSYGNFFFLIKGIWRKECQGLEGSEEIFKDTNMGNGMYKNNPVSPLIWYNGPFHFFIHSLLHSDSPSEKKLEWAMSAKDKTLF